MRQLGATQRRLENFHDDISPGRRSAAPMTASASAKPSWKDAIGIICALVSAAFVISGALRADGGRDKQLDDNTRRIEALERSDQAKADVLAKIDGRTIRIETTLEMMKAAKEMRP